MLCPSCNASLKEVTCADVVFTRCLRCKGVWLSQQAVEQLRARVYAREREWDREHRRYEPRPHYYADDDHYFLKHLRSRRSAARHPWSEMLAEPEDH